MTMLQTPGRRAYITVNAGTGDDWSAQGKWLNIATEMPPQPMGKQRAANGHPEPYTSSEVLGHWQRSLGLQLSVWARCSSIGFEYKHNQFAKAMKQVGRPSHS